MACVSNMPLLCPSITSNQTTDFDIYSAPANISLKLQDRFSPNFCACYLWLYGSIVLWWRSDTLCTSGFMDDVMFAHNTPSYKATRNGRVLKIAPRAVARGAESAVCRVGQKTAHQTHGYNSVKFQPIFTILSLKNSPDNLLFWDPTKH